MKIKSKQPKIEKLPNTIKIASLLMGEDRAWGFQDAEDLNILYSKINELVDAFNFLLDTKHE